MSLRANVTNFALANPFYIGATVTFRVVDENGNKGALAVIYEGVVGAAALRNPQRLDSQGKFMQPIYIDQPVIIEVSGMGASDHDTGVVSVPGRWRGTWTTATIYYAGEFVVAAASPYSVYQVDALHQSGVFATDLSAGKLTLAIDVSNIIAVVTAGTIRVSFAAATGTVNALAATFSPTIIPLTDGQLVVVRAAGANTSTTPTFSPNGATARTITRHGGYALRTHDIMGANHDLLLCYNAANTRWELLNPNPFGVVNVLNYGAKGDGTTDDTTAIRAAFNDSSQVHFPGTGSFYKVTDEIDLRGKEGIVILGDGNAASPASPGGFGGCKASSIRQATANKPIFRLSGYNCLLTKLYLDYATQATAAETSAIALELNNMASGTFRDLTIQRANKSIAIPQAAYNGTGHNTAFDMRFEQIHSYTASLTHLDLRNYLGGGTNSVLQGIYINGGGSLDFVTPGQSADHALRFTGWSGLEIGGVSIDGLIVNTLGIEFINCSYVAHTLRFEACTLKPNSAQWVDHSGGFNNGWIGLLDLTNDKWSPTAASSMYVVQAQSTIIKLMIEKLRIGSDCAFGSSGTRRAFINNGPALSGTGFVNDIRVRNIEDTGTKLTDLTWTDSTASPGPYNMREWNGSFPQIILRAGQSSTSARIVGGTTPPASGTWALGDIVFNLTPGDIGRPFGWQCITAGAPGTWVPFGHNSGSGGGATTWGDAAATLTPDVSRETNIWITPLTADRIVAISSTGQRSGVKFKISRPASGAFNLNVNNPAGSLLKALAAGDWCEVTFDSFNWRITAFGSGI